MAVFKEDIRLDNIFKEIMSDQEFCKFFPVEPGKYKNIAQGRKSDNKLIVALATSLQDIDKTIKDHHNSGKVDKMKNGIDYLETDEMKSIYRKIALLLT